MRPCRAADLPALVQLWREEVRSGRRDSVPREVELTRLLAHFDWEARSRVVEDCASALVGAVLVSSRPTTEGVMARVDPAATGANTDRVMGELARWGLQLSLAAGAAATQVWVGPGHADVLRSLGLTMARPWWRMDRTLSGELPEPIPVAGYELLDGRRVPQGRWSDMHNSSFADHWRYSHRSEDELMQGKAPELCLMAVNARTGEAGALSLCQIETYDDDQRPQPVGLVSSVGTLPQHRRRGLASWLVAEGLHRLRTAGANYSSLYVDGMSQTRAFDAYRKLGFELAYEAEVWEANFP
ncbi:MAG: GNAT family N-acetyltransferase [Candidatus Dormibacteraeota bacterium]|nr:GNAT family N-acetyltransferase [Candidatus Dormibacteraeota bacterium]